MGGLLGLVLVGVGAVGLGLYSSRRYWLARHLRLVPAQYAVGVERNLPMPMPDGTVLSGDHYFPKTAEALPTILIRSPWGNGWRAAPFSLLYSFVAHRFAERGYHVLLQSSAQRADREITLLPQDEAANGQATLSWIAEQPWFNGSLGMWGASIVGYLQWAVAIQAPPYLKAIVPCTTTSNWYGFFYQDRAVALDNVLRALHVIHAFTQPIWKVFGSMQRQDQIVAAAAQTLPLAEADVVLAGKPVPSYRDLLHHPDADDPYWDATNLRRNLHQVSAATEIIAGWHDLFLRESLADYAALRDSGHKPHLVVGPWHHLDQELGPASMREAIAWFDAHLKGHIDRIPEKPVHIYVMGTNVWHQLSEWPPTARDTHYYLQGRGALGPHLADIDSAPDHYHYDPADPTPVVGGPMMHARAGQQDNHSLEARPDVLVYTSAPLTADVEVIGTPRMALYVRSSTSYTDFVGRLCDVAPDGRSLHVCDGLIRVQPGVGTPQADGSLLVSIELWPTAYQFKRGHAIRLQIASGGHPRWSRNLGTGEAAGTATNSVVAEQTIYHDATHPSALILPDVSC